MIEKELLNMKAYNSKDMPASLKTVDKNNQYELKNK